MHRIPPFCQGNLLEIIIIIIFFASRYMKFQLAVAGVFPRHFNFLHFDFSI